MGMRGPYIDLEIPRLDIKHGKGLDFVVFATRHAYFCFMVLTQDGFHHDHEQSCQYDLWFIRRFGVLVDTIRVSFSNLTTYFHHICVIASKVTPFAPAMGRSLEECPLALAGPARTFLSQHIHTSSPPLTCRTQPGKFVKGTVHPSQQHECASEKSIIIARAHCSRQRCTYIELLMLSSFDSSSSSFSSSSVSSANYFSL